MNIADMDLVKFKEVVTLAATERGCELVELMLNDDDNVFEVVIDRKEGAYYVGRTEFCSPEVDPEVLIPVEERLLKVGRFYNVKIVDSEEFDLYGTTLIN